MGDEDQVSGEGCLSVCLQDWGEEFGETREGRSGAVVQIEADRDCE